MPTCGNCGSADCCYEDGFQGGDENALVEIRAALDDWCWEGCENELHFQCKLLYDIAEELAMRWTREAAHAAVMETTRRLTTDMPPNIRDMAEHWAEETVDNFKDRVKQLGHARAIASGHQLGQEVASFVDDDYFDDRVLDEPNCLFCGMRNSHWKDLMRQE